MKMAKMTARFLRKALAAMAMLSVIFVSSGCGKSKDVAYSDFRTVDPRGWERVEGLDFEPYPADSVVNAVAFDVVMVVRYTGSFKYKELLLDMQKIDDRGHEHHDTVRISLADDEGVLSGRGTYGLYEKPFTVARGVRLSRPMAISINHAMPDESLEGINNIGILLERHPAGH